MNRLGFESTTWYQATTLLERLALLRSASEEQNMIVNSDLAERRRQQWRFPTEKAYASFSEDVRWLQRLAANGLTEDEFLQILGEPIEVIQRRCPTTPAWLLKFTQAFSKSSSSEPLLSPESFNQQTIVGFLDVIAPLIRDGCEKLHEGIASLIKAQSHLPFDPDTIEDILFANLPGQLLGMICRTLVLELNVARLQNTLAGETPEERFDSFIQYLRQSETAIAIFQEYPVLARQLTIAIQQWVCFSLEFLQQLCEDWAAIRATFSPDSDPGILCELEGNAGDKHRGGKSVLIAKFSSCFQIVYKPKSLAVDVHFQELLCWLNERGNHPPFRTLKILNRGSYGWVEFVAAQGCTSEDEVQHFYQRQGGYLAILYILEAADFHSENVIAAGEHPILIDLEALFHPQTSNPIVKQADYLASYQVDRSVMGVGLLPQRIWGNAESEGIDISGLGAAAGQLTPNAVPQWDSEGTDRMQLNRKRISILGDQNRPALNGTDIDVLAYAEAITTGFTQVYQLLLQYRESLLSADGPLTRFAQDEVRVLLRATLTYALLLQESFHPDVLRNALDRDRLFDRLWIGSEDVPYLAQVIPAEQSDLWQGDIPIFTTRPDSRDLWTSSGDRIANVFDQPSMVLVQHRLQQLSDDDLQKQLWFIRASLTAFAKTEDHLDSLTYEPVEPQTIANRQQFLEAAKAIGDRLDALALRGETDIAWIGVTLSPQQQWFLVSLGLDLYGGIPGVALFLAYLGELTQTERYTSMAKAALETIQRQVKQGRSQLTSIGAFDGWGGILYTLTHLGALWQRPDLLAEAESLAELISRLVQQDEALDMVSGASGCICSLIGLYRCTLSQNVLKVAIQCGDRLISSAQPMQRGVAWKAAFFTTAPLCGFAHGAAGMALALLELFALTGEQRFQATALAAMEYERSLFNSQLRNWPDLRDFSDSILPVHSDPANPNSLVYMTAWCHGAAGIGLARLRSLTHLNHPNIKAEVDAALKTTLVNGFGGSHSLCHGDLGNLELLLQAGQILDDPQWKTQVKRFASVILESIDKYGWLCGVPLGVETPGLMTGLAGIGYGLLRLAEPESVPSVLVLEPPKLNRVVLPKNSRCKFLATSTNLSFLRDLK